MDILPLVPSHLVDACEMASLGCGIYLYILLPFFSENLRFGDGIDSCVIKRMEIAGLSRQRMDIFCQVNECMDKFGA